MGKERARIENVKRLANMIFYGIERVRSVGEQESVLPLTEQEEGLLRLGTTVSRLVTTVHRHLPGIPDAQHAKHSTWL